MKLRKMSSNEGEEGFSKSQRDEFVDMAGSHFALQVALQTMKERCQRLQQRLTFLEEENSRLKLQKPDNSSLADGSASGGSMKHELEQLKEQLSCLKRQKSQLSHQIIMVVTENKQLWNRLSHMTKVNRSLGGHLTKISDTLNQHSSGTANSSPKRNSESLEKKSSKTDISTSNYTTKFGEKQNIAPQANEERFSTDKRKIDDLEEISLKLLNSIQLEKKELEQQYAQMVEIHNDTSPSFNLNTMGLSFIYEDETQAVKNIKDHCRELEKMKQSLLDQKAALKNIVAKLATLKENEKKNCLECLRKARCKTDAPQEIVDMDVISFSKTNEDEENKAKNNWDRDIEKSKDLLNGSQNTHPKETMNICPMCGMKWSISTPFEIFQKHVTDHFPPDNNDFSSLGTDFEQVT